MAKSDVKYSCTTVGPIKACYDKSKYKIDKKNIYQLNENNKANKIGTIDFNGLRTVTVDMKPVSKDNKPRKLEMSFYGNKNDNIFSISNAKGFNVDLGDGVDFYYSKNSKYNSLKNSDDLSGYPASHYESLIEYGY